MAIQHRRCHIRWSVWWYNHRRCDTFGGQMAILITEGVTIRCCITMADTTPNMTPSVLYRHLTSNITPSVLYHHLITNMTTSLLYRHLTTNMTPSVLYRHTDHQYNTFGVISPSDTTNMTPSVLYRHLTTNIAPSVLYHHLTTNMTP